VRVGTERGGGEPVRVTARPGRDVVVLEIANGPTLVLHPAAALYRREPNLRLLEEDFARIPGLLEQGPPEQPEPMEPVPQFDETEADPEADAELVAAPADESTPETEPPAAATPREEQLGLF